MSVYWDHFAATPIRPEVMEVMQRCWRDHYANPDSIHSSGVSAQQLVCQAREQVAALLGARHHSQIVFTSGATESNNWAIRFLGHKAPTIWCLPGDHSSILRTAKRLRKPLAWLAHDRWLKVTGGVQGATDLVALSLVHSLVGTIQPLEKLGGLIHCDATAALGRLPLVLQQLPVASLAGSAHKFGGPHSVGILYLRRPKDWKPWLEGGRQQNALRSGTLDTAGIAGTAKALELAVADQQREQVRLADLREAIWALVKKHFPLAERLSPPDGIGALLSWALPHIHGETAVLWCSHQGVALSSGSACSHGRGARQLLEAVGLRSDYQTGHLRVSLGRDSSRDQLDTFETALCSLKKRFVNV